MKIIILGAGQVGTTLAQNLSGDHSITVVDQDPSRLAVLQQRYDIRTVIGMASYPDVLKEAGAENADMVIAVTSSDEANIVACQIAYALFNTPTKIARVRCRELLKHPELFQPGNLSIDTVINPAQLVIQRLVRQIEHPDTVTILDFAQGKVQLASVRATPPCNLIGRRIKELYQDLAEIEARLVAIVRNGRIRLAQDDLLVEPHDELYFCASTKDLNKVTQILLNTEQRYRRIIIAGAGNIGSGLASELEGDYNVKVLDSDPEQCESAAELLHKTIVLNGDASDADLLLSENIDETDLFCSVTNDDEANIMAAIVAKRLGARSTIALVNRQTYAHYLIERSPDIDMALSPQQITGGKLLTFLRKGDMVNVYPLPWCMSEAIELVVHGDERHSRVVGTPVGKVKLPPDTMIMALVRGDEILMAQEDKVIQEEDHVLLFVGNKSSVADVEKLFQVAPSFL